MTIPSTKNQYIKWELYRNEQLANNPMKAHVLFIDIRIHYRTYDKRFVPRFITFMFYNSGFSLELFILTVNLWI